MHASFVAAPQGAGDSAAVIQAACALCTGCAKLSTSLRSWLKGTRRKWSDQPQDVWLCWCLLCAVCCSAGLTRLLNATYNPPPEDSQGNFPVIVFSHG